MKNFKNISKRSVMRISAVCMLSVMLSSCLKDHTSDIPVTPVAVLSVIQASPDQPALNFSLDGKQVNSNSLNFMDDLDYFRAYVGKRAVKFSNASSSATVKTDTVNLLQNVAYSLFLVNKISSPEIFMLTDSLTQPPTGYASLRFVNLSPDAPGVDLAVKSGSVLVPNKHFKGFSSFAPILGQVYSFEIRQTGTSTVLATLNNVTINTGFVYSIYLYGLASSTGADKLTANLITNARPY